MPKVTAKNVGAILAQHADTKSRLHTDESNLYPQNGGKYATHETVRHSAGEYARGDVNTNSVEGFFGIFKRKSLITPTPEYIAGYVGIWLMVDQAHIVAIAVREAVPPLPAVPPALPSRGTANASLAGCLMWTPPLGWEQPRTGCAARRSGTEAR